MMRVILTALSVLAGLAGSAAWACTDANCNLNPPPPATCDSNTGICS
jgi:hypothetical protein